MCFYIDNYYKKHIEWLSLYFFNSDICCKCKANYSFSSSYEFSECSVTNAEIPRSLLCSWVSWESHLCGISLNFFELYIPSDKVIEFSIVSLADQYFSYNFNLHISVSFYFTSAPFQLRNQSWRIFKCVKPSLWIISVEWSWSKTKRYTNERVNCTKNTDC